MAPKSPKTPTSVKKLGRKDPDSTPTRKRPLPGLHFYPTSPRTPTRRNSFEEVAVNSLPDPRTPEHLAFQEAWRGPFLELSRLAALEFLPALELELARANRLPEFNRFFNMLRENAQHATIGLDRILDEACALFGRNERLVHQFNDILPPGFRMETHANYIAVFTPDIGWTEDYAGNRVCHPVIRSSGYSP